jgi:hypothetical protein
MGRERGQNVLDAPYDRYAIMDAIKKQSNNGRYVENKLYGDGRAGVRISQLLAEVPLKVEKKLMY